MCAAFNGSFGTLNAAESETTSEASDAEAEKEEADGLQAGFKNPPTSAEAKAEKEAAFTKAASPSNTEA
jgi:hypothetical protein